jgi:hypothetical protein
MKKRAFYLTLVLAMAAIAPLAFGHATYTGYSGAPATAGRCASSCHGTSGGTIQVTGLPAQYVPGHAYTITISHNGGLTIRQFNASCRVGVGSQNAGMIAASTNTLTYNVAGETNGIHLSATSLDNATFLWTAPVAGTGAVKLYLAGHQGSTSGANTDIVLTAAEQATAIDDNVSRPDKFTLLDNYPNPFNPLTKIRFAVPQTGNVTLEIYDVLGKKVATLLDGYIEAGKHSFSWDATVQPSGIYFCRLTTGGKTLTHGITLLK